MSATVLITGASTGIGRLAAETLARRGHTVYASMRDTAGRNTSAAESLQQLAGEEKLPLRTIDINVQKKLRSNEAWILFSKRRARSMCS